ncbi:hypothetical protein GCM10027514_28370 [Azotobacter armeniacus]
MVENRQIQVVLATKVIGDQSQIDTSLTSNGPRPCRVETMLAKNRDGGLKQGLPTAVPTDR